METPQNDPVGLDGSELCQACGLCCSGPIYETVALRPDEVPQVKKLRLRVVEHNAETALASPCSAFHDGRCSIYAQRPQGCRLYECNLLVKYQAGGSTLNDCLRVASHARALLAELEKQLPGDVTQTIWEKWFDHESRAEKTGGPGWKQVDPALVMNIVELTQLIRRHYDHRFRSRFTSPELRESGP